MLIDISKFIVYEYELNLDYLKVDKSTVTSTLTQNRITYYSNFYYET